MIIAKSSRVVQTICLVCISLLFMYFSSSSDYLFFPVYLTPHRVFPALMLTVIRTLANSAGIANSSLGPKTQVFKAQSPLKKNLINEKS